MKQFNLFIPMTKVDEKTRCVYGIATSESVDKAGEIFDYESSLPYYKEWSDEIAKASGGKSLGNVREMHTNIAAGKLTQIEFNDEKKQIEVCAKIVNDSTWEKVIEGVLTGFSHGGEYIKTWKDPENPKLIRYTARPAELSVVDNPCLGAATFELVRANGATEMRKFKTQEKTMTEAVIDGKPVQPKYKPIQKWEASDGKTFEKKEEWRTYELSLESGAVTNTVTVPALNALAELEKAVSEKEAFEKKDYSDDERSKMAESGEAMEDGSFPIASKQDLENAIQAYGRAKDKDKTKAHIEARAKALDAEDMLPETWDNKEEAEKKSKKTAAVAKLKKSLSEAFDSKCAIEALCTIEFLLMGEMNEEEDDPGQIADLKEAIDRLKSFVASEIMENSDLDKAALAEGIRKTVDEVIVKFGTNSDSVAKEIANAISLTKAGARHSAADKGHLAKAAESMDEASDHLDDAKKHHGKVGEAHVAMRGAHDEMTKSLEDMKDCMKCDKADTMADLPKAIKDHMDKMAGHLDAMDGQMDKADKFHAKLGKAHDGIEAAHDAAHHALKAVGAMDADNETEKAAQDRMQKAADELMLVKADLTSTMNENAELKKALETINGQVPSLIERIKKLEAQPMPAKGAVFPVTKGHEAKPAETPVEAPSYRTYGASPEQMREILNIR